MNRYSNSPRLVGNRSGYSLSYPPCGICGEFEALCIVEFFNGFDKTHVAFLDKVKEAHSSAHIFFCDRNNKSEVCFCQSFSCFFSVLFIAAIHLFCKLYLLLGGKKRHSAYFLKVDLDRVVDSDPVS